MLTCPQCKKTWPEPTARCASCHSDLSLLADFLVGVERGLSRAEAHVRDGELALAVREYLDVLEIDPENPTARKSVADWARVVRDFDRPRRKRRRHRRPNPSPTAPPPAEPPTEQPAHAPVTQPTCPLPPPHQPSSLSARLVVVLIWGILILVFGMGFLAGSLWGSRPTSPATEVTTPQE